PRSRPRRLHAADAAAEDGVLRRDAAAHPRDLVGAVRHASRPVGAEARRPPVLRAVLRNVEAVDPESGRPQVVVAVDAAGPSEARAVPDADAPAHAADDEAGGVSRRAQALSGIRDQGSGIRDQGSGISSPQGLKASSATGTL